MPGFSLSLRLSIVLIRAGWRSQLEHRANSVSMIIGGVAVQCGQLVFLLVVLGAFPYIAGWSLVEVGLLYSVRLAAHGVYVFIFGQVHYIDEVVSTGEFDRYLLRPVNPFVQLICRRTNVMALGDLLLGFLMLLFFMVAAPIDWSASKLAYLAASVVSGGLLEASAHTSLASLTFKHRSTQSARFVIDGIISQTSFVPLDALGALLLGVLTVFPVAFVAFIPVSVLLERCPDLGGLAILLDFTWTVGPLLFALSFRLFMREVTLHGGSSN